MTPQEKARELVDKMHGFTLDDSKSNAMTACDSIIEGVERAFDEYEKATGVYVKNRMFYWDFYSDVKGEIRKL
jgi:hypothetical protein